MENQFHRRKGGHGVIPRRQNLLRNTTILLIALFSAFFQGTIQGQDQTLLFSTSGTGVSKSITNWATGVVDGVDVVRSSLIHMGADQIDLVNIPFPMFDPLTSGTLSDASKSSIDGWLSIADWAGSKPLAMGPDTGAGINA